MKRYLLIIGVLLSCLSLRAQSVNYTCRYWFDQNFGQATTATFSSSTWQAELDVGSLPEGLHSLHIHVMDTSMMWSAPQSYLFMKLTPPVSSSDMTYRLWFDQDHSSMQSGNVGNGGMLLDVEGLSEGLHSLHVMLKGTEYSASQSYLFYKADYWENGTPNYVYHCWFDEDFANKYSGELGDGHLLFDVNEMEEGMHAVHVMVEGLALSSTQNYLFMKTDGFLSDTIDMAKLVYHCWFDQDFEHQQVDSLNNGHLLLDVNALEDGLHSVHVMLEGNTYTSTQSYMFMKMANVTPSAEVQYHFWFDQDYDNVQSGLLGSGVFELEVGDLPTGLHTLNVQLDNGVLDAPHCYLFFKQPMGGNGLARWEYWLNGNISDRQTINVIPSVDTLDIVSLLQVGHHDIRSSCFHFHPNGDNPYINAKNEITFLFWDNDHRFFDKSAYYIDYQVQQEIVASVFERNTTETFAAPRDNQITWFKLDAGRGDSLAFKANKACTMQLFAPSGEEVYSATASEAMTIGGCHAWEDGTYYLAVHDVTGSGETIEVTYNWVYKYAVLSYDAHVVGNGGCSTITFNGNGYNSLLDVYLVNAQNDTIRNLEIGHESNSKTTVTFNFYGVNLGVYDAVCEFFDETMQINGAIQVEEPVDIVLTSTVDFPNTYRRDTPCSYTYTITNNGNMTAYAVPIYVYISTATSNSISRIEFEGLDLPSIIDGIDTDNLTVVEIETMHEWVKGLDDMYCFNTLRKSMENDSITVRSNYFFMTLAPYETKTISINITSNEVINVQTTIPDEMPAMILPDSDSMLTILNRTDKSFSDWYCCVKDDYECEIEVARDLLEHTSQAGTDLAILMGIGALLSSEVPHLAAALGVGAGETLTASQIAGVLGMALSIFESEVRSFGRELCGGSGDPMNAIKQNNASMQKSLFNGMTLLVGGAGGTLLGQLNHWNDMYQAAKDGSNLFNAWLHGSEGVPQCIYKFGEERPGCPPTPPLGGQSTPVRPCEPNEIRGYLAESGSHYMMQEIQTITYEIESENDTTATAAAHTIIVRDTLDVNKFDVSSLAAHRVTIHDKVLELNGEHNFVYTLDLRPNVYVIAQIQQECDDETGIVVWTITSLDPMTMEPTDDPNQGALPINYNGEGIATFTFNVNLKEPFPDGTEINNRVGIIFDLEEVVLTDTWTNIVDAIKPVSRIDNVEQVADSLNFTFHTEDNRSGVWYRTLYYRNDSTDMQWAIKKARIFEDNLMLGLDDLQMTEYFVMAIDSAGNREDKDFIAEYIFGSGDMVMQVNNLSQGWNWFSTFIAIDNPEDGLEMIEKALGDKGLQIKSISDFTDFDGDEWFGGLGEATNEQMYMIEVSKDCTIRLVGLPVNPADVVITLEPGWNWIGFPSSQMLNVNDALAGFTPADGDQIKSIDDFTDFDGDEWFGGLEKLTQGQGFMYFNSSNEIKTLVFQTGKKKPE